jgi:hypothetical protein
LIWSGTSFSRACATFTGTAGFVLGFSFLVVQAADKNTTKAIRIIEVRFIEFFLITSQLILN